MPVALHSSLAPIEGRFPSLQTLEIHIFPMPSDFEERIEVLKAFYFRLEDCVDRRALGTVFDLLSHSLSVTEEIWHTDGHSGYLFQSLTAPLLERLEIEFLSSESELALPYLTPFIVRSSCSLPTFSLRMGSAPICIKVQLILEKTPVLRKLTLQAQRITDGLVEALTQSSASTPCILPLIQVLRIHAKISRGQFMNSANATHSALQHINKTETNSIVAQLEGNMRNLEVA
ncbi:hypothetical protein B0H11DRAFT_2363534 [Mycena galericulata]|nr:hypothetical protein B0H11DRAFT_2363534 [Mycena galericulata]